MVAKKETHPWIELKKVLGKRGINGLALDIDETLSDSGPTWYNHMMQFHTVDFTSDEMVKRYRRIEDVPEWSTDAARAHIHKGLESNEFNRAIPLLHESNIIVWKLNAIIPIVAYVSARLELVRKGTQQWLDRHQFPKADLILRPGRPGTHGTETRNQWKATVLAGLFSEVVGIVDDDPRLAEALAEIGYRGKLFLYGPQPRPIRSSDYPFEVIVSPDWSHVLDHFGISQMP